MNIKTVLLDGELMATLGVVVVALALMATMFYIEITDPIPTGRDRTGPFGGATLVYRSMSAQ